MSISFVQTLPTPAISAIGARRALLLAGCVAAVALAALVGHAGPPSDADPGLAMLLRGMAVIKGAMVLAAVAALWWRLARPVSGRAVAAGFAGTWLAAGATTLVWQLSFVPAAALAFHAGELTLLVAAWREHRAETSEA